MKTGDPAFEEFINGTLDLWGNYLNMVSQEFSNRIPPEEKGRLLFPSLALFTETDNHYIFELLGANPKFSGLKCFRHAYPSTTKYFGQFEEAAETIEEDSILDFAGRGGGVRHYVISTNADVETLKQRFDFIVDEQWPSHIEHRAIEGPFFFFRETFQSCFIDNCILVNSFGGINRVKYIAYAEIISKSFPLKLYWDDLLVRLGGRIFTDNDLFGVKYFRDLTLEDYAIAGQFANVFLMPNLRETTIGQFLNKHPDFIKKALKCKDFLYEPSFRWIEGPSNLREQFINPDLMLEKENNYYDICELKTAVTKERKIAKADHARRRFIDYVGEGIAQLANYENYFDYEKNAEFAWSKFQVRVKAPKLILVVGNQENASKDEVKEAGRSLKESYTILDYDTLNSLFLANSKTTNGLQKPIP